jgi:glycosyltransferase involved in cell wall biosynthesis
MKIDFCLPIYNEEKILNANVTRLLQYCESQAWPFDWRLNLLINGSTDRSEALAKNLAAKHQDRIRTISYAQPGKGRTLGRFSRGSQADILVYMDVDLAVSLENIQTLIDPVLEQKADIVIGSRLLPDSRIDRSFLRELSSQTYNYLSKIILGHNFSDLQCGFKAIKGDLFKKVAPYIKDNKWFFDTELITLCYLSGGRVKEIPVDWSENRYEDRKSKVNIFKDGFKFIFRLFELKIRLNQIDLIKSINKKRSDLSDR